MPSPVGHAIGGVCAGWAAAGRAGSRLWIRQAVCLGAVGMLPDIDLLFGGHSGPTHSIGAALIVAAAAWAIRARRPHLLQGLTPVAIAAAYSSHVVLDWLGEDTSSPHGVMALWPLSGEHYISPIALMPSITRRYWLPGFWEQNIAALAFELALLGPILLLVWWKRKERASDRPRSVLSGVSPPAR